MAKVENESDIIKAELKVIGNKLKASRLQKKLTIWSVSKLTNMSWHNVKKMELGSSGYSIVSYIKYTQAVNSYAKKPVKK